MTAKHYYDGVVRFWPIQPRGGGKGNVYVPSNTVYFNVLLEVGGRGAWGRP